MKADLKDKIGAVKRLVKKRYESDMQRLTTQEMMDEDHMETLTLGLYNLLDGVIRGNEQEYMSMEGDFDSKLVDARGKMMSKESEIKNEVKSEVEQEKLRLIKDTESLMDAKDTMTDIADVVDEIEHSG